MALTIAGTSPLIQAAPSATPPPRAASQAKGATEALSGEASDGSGGRQVSGAAAGADAPAGSAGKSSAQQQAALKQLLAKYAYDQTHGSSAQILAALGKQIMAAAKALGQTVTLPKPPSSSAAAPATAVTSAAPHAGKLSLTA